MQNKNNHLDILDSEKTLLALKELEVNPQITQRALAHKLEVSLGKVNFLLNALLNKGIIEIKNFKNSKNKLAYTYLLTPHGIKTKIELTHKFLTWKIQEYEKLRREIEHFQKEISMNDLSTGGKENNNTPE
ncbi:MAG: MarR family EPS-associated transcriptional regulator [Candidatus Omnitrophica bacterium]|nr:MarR family EPS-associated transcriptional regulator [Candidatus Omnitrophota bacterium]